MSKPLQVYLHERDLKDLDAWVKARGWTKSQAIRAAVRALVRPEEDPILSLSGIAQGLPLDASANFNKYFAETSSPNDRHRTGQSAGVPRSLFVDSGACTGARPHRGGPEPFGRIRHALSFDRHFEIAGFERWRG